MNPKFPLNDVNLRRVEIPRTLNTPVYADTNWQINQNEFAMQVEGVGSYYAFDGKEIEYAPAVGANEASVELYLNGSVYGAILHQRKILPFHGSSFIFNNLGIMISGESGAGKSSLTTAFCVNGAEFLTDDVTPVLFKEGSPYIWALSDRIKLWKDSLQQLDQDHKELDRIDPETEKFYYPIGTYKGIMINLNKVYILELHDNPEVKFQELTGAPKFMALRNEIYRFEYLQGMPENEKIYFSHLADISNEVSIIRINRPPDIKIISLVETLKKHIC